MFWEFWRHHFFRNEEPKTTVLLVIFWIDFWQIPSLYFLSHKFLSSPNILLPGNAILKKWVHLFFLAFSSTTLLTCKIKTLFIKKTTATSFSLIFRETNIWSQLLVLMKKVKKHKPHFQILAIVLFRLDTPCSEKHLQSSMSCYFHLKRFPTAS